MLSKIAVAALFASSAMAADGYAAVATTVAVVAGPAPEYYYADYDNIVVAAKDAIYYQSAVTPEAVAREGAPAASAASWSAPKEIAVAAPLYNAKGATFCGEWAAQPVLADHAKAADVPQQQWGGKYKQVFVADEGDATHAGQVIGWEVVEDPKNPAAVVLKNGWQVYSAEGAQPVDVECGPNNGLFIADKGANAVRWVTYDALVAKKENPKYAEVIAPDCGAIVDNVRSLNWDAETGKLSWTNNDQAVVENAGVFQYNAGVEAVKGAANCDAAKCDAWAQDCAPAVKKVVDAAAGEQQWAVANAWGKLEVSKGGEELYDQAGKEVAAVPQVATYAEPTEDAQREVLLVADEKEGAVYAVPSAGAAPKEIGQIDNAYGVAYNDAAGWVGIASANTVTLAIGAVLGAMALLL